MEEEKIEKGERKEGKEGKGIANQKKKIKNNGTALSPVPRDGMHV